jgi:hypothetical protein
MLCYMAKTFDVPSAPPPSAASAPEGVEKARVLARRFLPDAVNLLAAIALGGGESAAHTKLLACKQLVEIAGLVPPAIPAPPQPQAEGGDSGEPS